MATIGYSPFGLDYTRNFESPSDPSMTAEKAMAPTALNYELIGPMMRDIARLSFEGKLQTAVDERESTGTTARNSDRRRTPRIPALSRPIRFSILGPGTAPVWFRPIRRFEASPTTPPAAPPPPPNGRVLVAQLGDNQFLVTGLYSRIGFLPARSRFK